MSLTKNVSLVKKCFTWKIWLTQKSIKVNATSFSKENSFFRFENCGKCSENFGKCNALRPSKPLEEYVYKLSARLLKNSTKKRLPHKNYFTRKSVFQKKFYHEKWVLPENCVLIKNSVSHENHVSPKKMFHLKNLTNPKKY